MPTRKLFLSYSVTGDPQGRHFVRTLLARLREQQGLDPWVYESWAGRIRAGASIADTCRQRIEEADIFVVLATDAALRSDYVAMEIAHALWLLHERRRQNAPPLAILPLIATSEPQSRWPHALVDLTGLMGRNLAEPLLSRVEEVVLDICELAGIPYAAPGSSSARLPLAHRLATELQEFSATSGKDVEAFEQVMKRCTEVMDAIERADFGRARTRLEFLMMQLEAYDGFAPYYPRIVQASVAMAEAHAGTGSYAEAERQFSSVIADAGSKLDANAYAGRGNARLAQGLHREAINDYAAAEPLLDAPDPALFYNMVRARTLARVPIEAGFIAAWHAKLSEGFTTRTPGDGARLAAVLALAFGYCGDIDAALEAWRAIDEPRDVFPEVVFDIGYHLHRHALDMPGRAASFLRAAGSILDDFLMAAAAEANEANRLFGLRQLNARVTFDSGDHRRGREIAEQLASTHPASPAALMDAALYALANEDLRRARLHCASVTQIGDYAQCNPRTTFGELSYYRGQALWLLGRADEANQSFRQSGYPAEHGYDATLRLEFGRLR